MQRLYNTGLRNFLVMNVGTIGCVPAIRAVPTWGLTCQSDANAMAALANALIDSRLADLRKRLPDAIISVIDIFQGFYDVSAIMSEYCHIRAPSTHVSDVQSAYLWCSNKGHHLLLDIIQGLYIVSAITSEPRTMRASNAHVANRS